MLTGQARAAPTADELLSFAETLCRSFAETLCRRSKSGRSGPQLGVAAA